MRLGAADWTEVEGGVTSLFQVLAHLRRVDSRAVIVMATQTQTTSVKKMSDHVYLLPAGAAVAEQSELSDWLFSLRKGDGHHQQQIKSQPLTET